jgi:hypothetical protein
MRFFKGLSAKGPSGVRQLLIFLLIARIIAGILPRQTALPSTKKLLGSFQFAKFVQFADKNY